MTETTDSRILSFLMGELSEEQTAQFEQTYFSDTSLFNRLQAAEDGLIATYVTGKLSRRDKLRFQRRLSELPGLHRRVTEAHTLIKGAGTSRTIQTFRGWLASGAVAAALVVVAFWPREMRIEPRALPTELKPAGVPTVSLLLYPGVSMGGNADAGSRMSAAAVSPEGLAQLTLVIPDSSTGVQASVKVLSVDDNGDLHQVWEGPNAIAASLSGENRTVGLRLSGAILRPGDYRITALVGRRTFEYGFRALAPR